MDDVLRSQIDYYDARADEYDDFWLRRGRYALSEPLATAWRQDAGDTLRLVRDHARGAALELAGGTGIFTAELHRAADSVHVVDASPSMLEINRRRLGGADGVTYEVADLFTWRPVRTYDTVFFGFWLSHVPDDRLAAFWSVVRDCLAPEGRVVLVDSRPHPEAGDAAETRLEDRTVGGRAYQVVKRYWTPATLTQQLAELGWTARVTSSAHDLMVRGVVEPVSSRPRRAGRRS